MPQRSVHAAILFLLLTSTAAFAHAELEKSSPPANAALPTAPAEVAIDFSEEVEPKFSTIEVQDGKGTRVDKGDVHAAPDNAKHLAVSLKPLEPGTYKVIWHVLSIDTHKTNGSYKFKVAP
jgi:methionine-rich copper-binding protein CopC